MVGALTRRRFFFALAASALAAGVPLPIGFPRELKAVGQVWSGGYSWQGVAAFWGSRHDG